MISTAVGGLRQKSLGLLIKPHCRPKFLPNPNSIQRRALASTYQSTLKEGKTLEGENNKAMMVAEVSIAIPERLLIYHAGTGKLVVLGMLKVTTLFILSTSLISFAPQFSQSHDQPLWAVPAGKGAETLVFSLLLMQISDCCWRSSFLLHDLLFCSIRSLCSY